MNGRLLKCGFAMLVLPVAVLPAQKTNTYDLSTGTVTGETVRGPRIIRATGINTIRYDYEFGNSATYGSVPDLWTGLTALATTQATQSPAPAVTAKVPAPGALRLAVQAQVRAPGSPDPTALTAAINNADDQLAPIQSFNLIQGRVTQILSGLATQTASLHSFQIQANVAIGLVAQSKTSLTNYLQTSTNDISDLVQTTTAEIAPGSNFTLGIGPQAAWPSAQATTQLSQDLTGTADRLTAETTASAIYLPTLTASLKSSETSLPAALATLKAASAAYRALPNPDRTVLATEQTAEESLQAAILALPADEKFISGLTTQLTLATTQSATAVAAVTALLPQSTTFVAFASDQEILLRWDAKMQSKLTAWSTYTSDPTKPNPFAKSADPATCDFAFSTTKDTVVTLTRLDLTPGVQNPVPQTMLTIKVECTSPFSIAAGVVFSTIPDRSFSIAATPVTPPTTPPATQNTFTQTGSSNFHPLPLAMIHVRVYEWSERLAFYGSFGVAANIRSPTSGGSAAEYLFGPSFGFFRTAFLTAGLHLGNEPNIGNGYSVGGLVPSTVTAVPISTTYRPGFGLGITFTKP